ncbi:MULTISPECIES: mechanosensitive ion channel family protein [unclassified Chelatococcus]|uniref:mechanosensitive ion channel family protein n=1 Tax=unclassified Chelatococcus TaxID=2638111 RepID=UPI001BCE4CD2|nr:MULTISPECIES: mechanosensitive ion channel family protein [unclassified Chelatococcus]MBS7697760.1 mechanosensitive ion channel family protein [Chelatococcus sp. YT9]MBX3558383.1 mechanosensitive ion channel family protein [Chelatococcus sp.]
MSRAFNIRPWRLAMSVLAVFVVGMILGVSVADAATPAEAPQAEAATGNVLRNELDSGFTRAWAKVDDISGRLATVLAALPAAPRGLAEGTVALLGTATYPVLTLSKALAVVLVVIVLPPLISGLIRRWMRHVTFAGPSAGAILRHGLLDIVALGITVAVVGVFGRRLLQGPTLFDTFAVGLGLAAVQWRIWMLPFLILLRPADPEQRLAVADNHRARMAYRSAGLCFAAGFVAAKYLPLMVDVGMPIVAAQAAGTVVGALIMIGAMTALQRFFAQARGWRKTLGIVAKAMVVVGWALWTIGLSMLKFQAYNIVFWAMEVAIATYVVERLLSRAIAQRAANGAPGHDKNHFSLLHIMRRVVVPVAAAVVLVMLARSWLVDVLGVFSWEEWLRFDHALIMVVTVLILGHIAYELLGYWSATKLAPPPVAVPADAGHEDLLPGTGQPTSRLSSIMPVVRGFFGVLVVATALLLGLSHLGVNISPLLAGAGIFGLAFSFGSQTLVKDIVSGVFFVADDAFRVGEYIQAGSHKGTVEKLSLRSVRVRHQNGQFHTIPYGQLGAVTNFSRDYATIKFNLRLARDTDMEKARKLAKKVGVELAEMPEYADQFIAPFKMQGVTDIEPNALLCRFKFTVKPGKQTMIQREAIKRLHKAYHDNGIEFASNAVVVQGQSGAPHEQALEAAGAAATTLTPAPSPAG